MIRRALLLVAVACLPAQASQDPLARAIEAVREGRSAEAAGLYRDMAEQGDGRAQFNLALLFLDGRGVPQSHAEAYYWAWRARLSGVREAPVLLARMAPAVTDDLRAATAERIVADLTPRVEAGEGRAMLELAGVLVELSPEADLEGGFVWQAIAAALDIPGAVEAREATGDRLAPEDRLEAESRAAATLADLCGKGLSGNPVCAAFGTVREQGQTGGH